MLIKSQDGNSLFMFTGGFIYIRNGGDKWVIGGIITEIDCTLAIYSTEAQAKEVLDNIIVKYGIYTYPNTSKEFTREMVKPKTFVMPQDKGADYGNPK